MEINQIENEKNTGDFSFVSEALMNPELLDERPVLKEFLSKEKHTDLFEYDILDFLETNTNETSM